VPGRERGIDPLDHRDPGARPPRDLRGYRGEPVPEAADQLRGPLRRAGPRADGEDRAEHFVEAVRVEREHVGAAPQVVQGFRHVPRGQRADAAQVLRQDQVGAQPGECVRVQRVQVLAARQVIPNVGVDLTRAHPRRIPAAHHDFLLQPGGRRLVTLEGDPDEFLPKAERVHDLGRGRQQGHKAHPARISTARGSRRLPGPAARHQPG
jgi:hypothetical protein